MVVGERKVWNMIFKDQVTAVLAWIRCQEDYSNNNNIFFLTDLEARVQVQYIWHHVDSSLYPNLLTGFSVRSSWLGHHLKVVSHISCLLCVSVCFFLKDTNYLRVVAHSSDLISYELQLYTVGNQGFVPRDGGEDLKFHCQRTQPQQGASAVHTRTEWQMTMVSPTLQNQVMVFSARQISLGGQLS